MNTPTLVKRHRRLLSSYLCSRPKWGLRSMLIIGNWLLVNSIIMLQIYR